MKITKVDHVGIAVKNLDESLKFFQDVLGLECVGTEVVEEQKVKCAFMKLGESKLELLESTSDDGPIAKFIEKNGEGVQQLALGVDNVEEAIQHMKDKGIRMIDEKPRYGAGNAKIAFVHPKGAHGILLELTER